MDEPLNSSKHSEITSQVKLGRQFSFKNAPQSIVIALDKHLSGSPKTDKGGVAIEIIVEMSY